MKTLQKGALIVIDGADGAGKATQTQLLVEHLRADGWDVEKLDFPRYDTNMLGGLIREGLDGKRGDFMHLDARIASSLYAGDRFESRPIIDSWLAAGKVVVLDRYVTSNMLHQGAKLKDAKERTELLEWLDRLEHGVYGLPRPDAVIYLDIPWDVRAKLVAERGGADLSDSDVLHQQAADACAKEIATQVSGWHTILSCDESGTLRSREDVHADVYAHVAKLLA